MRHTYKEINFKPATLELIEQANEIIAEYRAQGFSLTLRQLYYQFVSRDLIRNKVTEYKRLGSVINDARLAGYIDWLAIEDRTRNLSTIPTWKGPAEILKAAHDSYRTDKWKKQETRIEVWIEKDALTGVIEPICRKLEVPYFACRGYNSQSEQYRAAQRFADYVLDHNQKVVVLHLGDHDPSGIDMSRDNEERIKMLMAGDCSYDFTLERIALNYDQIEEYDPPPNPAKESDSRIDGYRERYGESSWELDALDPTIISALIEDKVNKYRDMDLWEEAVASQEEERALIKTMITTLR